MTSPSLDRSALLTDLQKLVLLLEEDLREQVTRLPEVKARPDEEYATAVKARRTAASPGTFLGEEITQAAVAWVLGTVDVGRGRREQNVARVASAPGRPAAADRGPLDPPVARP